MRVTPQMILDLDPCPEWDSERVERWFKGRKYVNHRTILWDIKIPPMDRLWIGTRLLSSDDQLRLLSDCFDYVSGVLKLDGPQLQVTQLVRKRLTQMINGEEAVGLQKEEYREIKAAFNFRANEKNALTHYNAAVLEAYSPPLLTWAITKTLDTAVYHYHLEYGPTAARAIADTHFNRVLRRIDDYLSGQTVRGGTRSANADPL